MLRDRGVSIIYVSHRLEEIFRVADRVTVLRDGSRVATLAMAGLTQAEVVRHIVGSDLVDLFDRKEIVREVSSAAPRLSVRGLGDGKLRDISFEVRETEIVGLAGLGSSGRSRLLRILFGAGQAGVGDIAMDGRPVALRNTRDALSNGIALITEDRNEDGFVETLPIWQNVTLPWSRHFKRAGLLQLGRERSEAAQNAMRLAVRMPSIDASMTALSGGNQQKAIFARWLTGPVRLLLLDEPTHGVDIGSKAQIYDTIRKLAGEGLAIVVASSELEELQALCDRVLILKDGTIVSELRGADISKDAILHRLLATDTRAGALQ
jgi:ABC-type sugar transport system ATPase subunit